ncbi:MAG TPA: insulinase family protein [Kofleriaceae bacterium]|nr:insulinase family protein [Kofleriaceae bacterium]
MQIRPLVAVVALLAACGSPNKPVTAPAPAPAPHVAAPVPPPHDPMADVSPLDPQIKIGHLANGLTYYIMKHQKPEQRASLWLAVNAGSVLEDDDQRGLAHFCEHMAFNGTKRFPKMDIVNYIEKVGMVFGPDVNAYTSFDQTVYQLTVPTDDHAIVMKGLDILRDWAGDVTFDPVEVDKERGVVLEEWRLGRGAFARINDKQWPIIFGGSRYAERLPIGQPEIIKTAKRDTLYRFYKDWYRPDQMAVIAVGDFDPADLEKQIQARFGDLTNPTTERPRIAVPVPHDQPTTVTIATDPEMPYTSVSVYDKMDHRPQVTYGDYRRLLVERLYHQMLRARFAELALDPAAPFVYAGSYTTSFARTSDLFIRDAQAKAGHTPEVLGMLFKEIARVEKFGFLPSELDRARKTVLADYENEAKEWDKTPEPAIADEITRNFFNHEQMPGRALELQYAQQLLPTITLDELNHLAHTWGGDVGRVIALSGPESAKLPSEGEVRELVREAQGATVEAWKDTGGDRPLMAAPPAGGKVTASAHDDATGATVWTLSNGIKVVVKPTTFQNDEIMFDGWKLGGTSLLSDADYEQVRFGGLVTAMGVGDLDPTALRKVLAGKVASVNVGYGELSENAGGSTRPADLETAMQLLYLRITAPRKDEKAFAAWKQQQIEWLSHKELLPEVNFFEQMTAVRAGDHLRRRPTTAAMLDKVDLDKALAIYKRRFADCTGMTFVFVGNIDPAVLEPLVERYIGALPTAGHAEHWKDIGIKYPTGKLEKTVVAGTEPKSFVSLTMGAPDKWTLDNDRDAEILSMVLRIRLREVMREDMGGVYGVQVRASISREPKQRRELSIFFGCDPANIDKLRAAAFAEIGKFAKDGAGDDYIAKVREQLRREHEVNLKENSWWLDQLRDQYYFGDDFTKTTDIDATIARVTSDHIKASAKKFFDPAHYVIGVMKPKQVTSPAKAPPGSTASHREIAAPPP